MTFTLKLNGQACVILIGKREFIELPQQNKLHQLLWLKKLMILNCSEYSDLKVFVLEVDERSFVRKNGSVAMICHSFKDKTDFGFACWDCDKVFVESLINKLPAELKKSLVLLKINLQLT